MTNEHNGSEHAMTNTDAEAHDMEAMRVLGKPYSECNDAERDAVEFAVMTNTLADVIRSRGARTTWELFER